MILNFLQTRNPPVLPCLHKRPHQKLMDSEGNLSSFADDISSLRGLGTQNNETLGELLFHFFRRHAHEIDYEKNVLSVRDGQLISKEAKKWHLMQNNRLCVEEPFNTERNLGNTADDISFRGVHLELRRAFDLISEAKLDECLKQYEFPAIEEKFWEKPLPRPPPILSRSRSQSQSGRGGKNGFGTRGGRNASTQHRTGPQARRASSAAALYKFGGPQIASRNNHNQDHVLQAHFQQLHLHDRLFNEYQFLQAQEHELRALQQARQAQAQLHAHSQAQGSNSTSSNVQHPTGDNLNRSATANKAPPSAPLLAASVAYPFVYPPMHGTAQTHQSIHTNPPSPSMIPVQPEPRRRVHRSSATDSDANLNMRSHSQPARLIPPGFAIPNMQAFSMPMNANGFVQHYQGRQQHNYHLYNSLDMNQAQQRPPDHARRRPIPADMPFEENVPKEYIGYYVHDSPPARSYREDAINARMSNYNDFSYRYRGLPPGVGRLINSSRSPSPSPAMPLRDRSFSVRSASSAPPAPLTHERAQNPSSANRSSGPIIVDGSGGWGSHELSTTTDHSFSSSYPLEMMSVLEDQGYETPSTPTITRSHSQGRHEPFGHENAQPYIRAPSIHDSRRPSDPPRNSLIEPLMRRTTTHFNEVAAAKVGTKRSEYASNGHGLGIEFERSIRRQSVDSERLPPQEPQHGYPTPKSDTKPDAPTSRYDYSPKTVPLLSPVREVRTPSPTANRKEDIFIEGQYTGRFRAPMHLEIPSFSSIMNGRQKQVESPAPIPNGRQSSVTESPRTPQQSLTNGWQQPSKKGKKIKSKSQSSQMPMLLSAGEPLPPNEAERKGG